MLSSVLNLGRQEVKSTDLSPFFLPPSFSFPFVLSGYLCGQFCPRFHVRFPRARFLEEIQSCLRRYVRARVVKPQLYRTFLSKLRDRYFARDIRCDNKTGGPEKATTRLACRERVNDCTRFYALDSTESFNKTSAGPIQLSRFFIRHGN